MDLMDLTQEEQTLLQYLQRLHRTRPYAHAFNLDSGQAQVRAHLTGEPVRLAHRPPVMTDAEARTAELALIQDLRRLKDPSKDNRLYNRLLKDFTNEARNDLTHEPVKMPWERTSLPDPHENGFWRYRPWYWDILYGKD